MSFFWILWYFAKWILYLHINIIPLHNTTKIFIHCEYSVKSMIVYISNYHLKKKKISIELVLQHCKNKFQLTFFKPRTILPYLQVLLTKQTMLCKDQVCFQFWGQSLCTKKQQKNFNEFITWQNIFNRWEQCHVCFLPLPWHVAHSVSNLNIIPGDNVHMDNLSVPYCPLATQLKDSHLHSTVVNFLEFVITCSTSDILKLFNMILSNRILVKLESHYFLFLA